MKPDKNDYLKQKDVPGSGKFRIKGRWIPGLGIYTKGTFVYSLLWKGSGKIIHEGSWNSCVMSMEDLRYKYKSTNGKPYPWQFISPVTYYNAMERYITKQKEQITTEQKK